MTNEQRLFAPAVDDERVSPLIVACLVPAGGLAPRRHRMASAGGLAFAAAMRMIHRVHRNAAVMRTFPQPACPSGFPDGDVLVIGVADLPDRRHAVLRDFARLAR